MTASARQDLAVAASLLEQGRTINALSLIMTAFSFIALSLLSGFESRTPNLGWVVFVIVFAAGLGQTYFAIRVGLDAALFRGLAAQETGPDLAALDKALQGQGLLPQHKAGRPLAERIAGARRLFNYQSGLLLVQVAILIVGGAIGAVR
jgi:hypothetical protein